METPTGDLDATLTVWPDGTPVSSSGIALLTMVLGIVGTSLRMPAEHATVAAWDGVRQAARNRARRAATTGRM